MKIILPNLFPASIDCDGVRNVIADNKYVIIFMLDGSHLKSVPQNKTLPEMQKLATGIQIQIQRCRATPKSI